jgi:hypothetical protein
MVAVAFPPLPPSVEVTALVVLFCVPALMPETFTVKLQEALAVSVAPERLTLPDPAVAVIVPPPQLPVRPFGVETTRPEGIVSVKPIPVSDVPELGFDKLKVRDALPFIATLADPKAFAMVGGNVLGGGGPLPAEPPPHAQTYNKLKIAAGRHQTGRISLCIFPTCSRKEPVQRELSRSRITIDLKNQEFST